MPPDPLPAEDAARLPCGGPTCDPSPERPAKLTRLPWMDAFIAALKAGRTVRQALGVAGTSQTRAYSARRSRPWFKAEWDAASGRAPADGESQAVMRPGARSAHWRQDFLAALAETSNVSASAARAGTEPGIVYRIRRSDPGFAAKWRAALFEGYEHLELEVLGHLRSPDPERKLDVAAALRLLAAHRETVARLKLLAGEEDEAAVRDSIDAFLEDMRQRRLANQAILIEGHEIEGHAGEAGDVAG